MADARCCNAGGKIVTAAIALRDELPRVLELTRAPAKILAFKARVSKRTIDSVRRKEHTISAPALLELARAFPEVRALVLELIGAPERDPARILEQIRKMVSK